MSVLKNLRTCSFCSETIKGNNGIFAFVHSGLLKGRWLCCSENCSRKLKEYAEEIEKYEMK